jgi:hypothetical protein
MPFFSPSTLHKRNGSKSSSFFGLNGSKYLVNCSSFNLSVGLQKDTGHRKCHRIAYANNEYNIDQNELIRRTIEEGIEQTYKNFMKSNIIQKNLINSSIEDI